MDLLAPMDDNESDRELKEIEMLNVKKGDTVLLALRGASVVSYERFVVGKVSKAKNRIYLDGEENNIYTLDGELAPEKDWLNDMGFCRWIIEDDGRPTG
jgi:hypothetical protein